MSTVTASASSLRTFSYASTSQYSTSAAYQGNVSSGRLVGVIVLDNLGTTLKGTAIKSITLEPTIGKVGSYGNGSRTITFCASNYQTIDTTVTGQSYVGAQLGTLVGNGSTSTGTDSTYAGSQKFTLNSTTNAELFAAMSSYLSAGNTHLLVFNDETTTSSSGYSSNYMAFTAFSITVEYEQGVVYIDNEAYQAYIDNGTGWDLYIPYIDDGTSWTTCG